MTVAEIVPLTAGLAALGFMGALPGHGLIVALALCGAMIGFAPFNKPVARLFLGDAGSLPIGLMVGWLLILLVANGHLAAAILLPLYYLADATITLGKRMVRREKVWVAHRGHFYQRAFDSGMSAANIVVRVFVTNIVLVVLSICTVWLNDGRAGIVALVAGCVLVGILLRGFTCVRR
jgi:UDP-N-acetylmuramyl pentapeptide phosphotransferase/UDP-N-acetylglucosamine-1-phosphate transferase